MSDMGPDLELKGRSNIYRVASRNKEPIDSTKEIENNHMNRTSNCEGKRFDMKLGTIEQTEGTCRNMDVEKNTLEEKWDPALTESSSSFDSDGTSFSEAEVNPELFDDALSAFAFDDYSDIFRMRKKKLSSNWRKCIAPLMWRCKWVELQIKKFESQAQKYDRQIAEYNGRKQMENRVTDNINTKSLPFAAQSQRNSVMKRKKRRRAEDTEDLESYMSHHNLFSYFENKKSAADAACADGVWGNQGAGGADKTSNGTAKIEVDEELLSYEFNDGGNSLEQIFWKIGLLQWQLGEMKIRAHKVVRENASRFSSTENLSLLVSSDNNPLTSSAENPASPLKIEDKITASSISNEIVRDESDTKMIDVALPETAAALRLGELKHIPKEDIKSSTLPAIEGSSRNPSGAILIYNRRAKTNSNKSKEVNIVPTQKKPKEENHESSSTVPSSQDPSEPSTTKIRSISEMMNTGTNNSNKRKRAMRKAGFGKWNH